MAYPLITRTLKIRKTAKLTQSRTARAAEIAVAGSNTILGNLNDLHARAEHVELLIAEPVCPCARLLG